MVGQRAHEHVDPAGGALRVGAGRDVGRQAPAARRSRRCRRSRAPAPRRAVRSSSCMATSAMRSATRRPRPGRNEARTRQARSPSRRSRLAGCTWSAANGSVGDDARRWRSAPRSTGRAGCRVGGGHGDAIADARVWQGTRSPQSSPPQAVACDRRKALLVCEAARARRTRPHSPAPLSLAYAEAP